MSYILAITVKIVFKSLQKRSICLFLVLQLGKQHVFTSSNYNGVSFYSEHQEA